MLQLNHIVKTYVTGDLTQDALKGVSIAFRESEFVSILGQSGSGKTTLLNIIGGLDRYTSGDLLINGVSTREYNDADWDYYRNNSIGFVFQSYNLIPHQSVLANVEMALTLAGVSRKERRERALSVLKKVGLADHVHKKPNQMSGGQMQRVAIARALVNNPDILLADEPTGALDSETSVQIMELLKEIAKDKLVIMVTHNPELAEKYSTRIVRLLDSQITSDSNPYDAREAQTGRKPRKKISMSFGTALSLSFNNLRIKKGRTLLTAFAGSIGIIGIALILTLSTGMNAYIADVQKDTMASYPITITSEAIDVSGVMGMRAEVIGQMREGASAEDSPRTGVYADYTQLEQSEKMSASVVENNLTEFKKYLDDPDSEIRQYLGENGIAYSYDVSFRVYARDPEGGLLDTDTDPDGKPAAGTGGGIMSRLTSSITTIINGIFYVLIAFVAISLVVSCIMIGIITHISVMERTKEIGILRALGASKRNISQVFNAETFIIGCCAGVLGIGVSLLALLPINAIIAKVSGLTDLTAQLPVQSSLILIAISIVITILGGLIPAKKAARKDPVIALRTE